MLTDTPRRDEKHLHRLLRRYAGGHGGTEIFSCTAAKAMEIFEADKGVSEVLEREKAAKAAKAAKEAKEAAERAEKRRLWEKRLPEMNAERAENTARKKVHTDVNELLTRRIFGVIYAIVYMLVTLPQFPYADANLTWVVIIPVYTALYGVCTLAPSAIVYLIVDHNVSKARPYVSV